ncbi:MAG TPA: glycosyltransferase family 4 protein [Stellaceae bacterium]|nr:glycosyltransferase family 4 protein [Stellaceae bacterium]
MCKPKLIFFVTEDWYFLMHRLAMARAAQQAGFEVGVITKVTGQADRIRELGIALHPIELRRGSLSLWGNLSVFLQLRRILRRERPTIVQNVSWKPIALGGIAAWLTRAPFVVSTVTGTGYIGGWRGFKARILARLNELLLRFLLARPNHWFIVENDDDRRAFVSLCAKAASRVVNVGGSGVDLDRFQPVPEPPPPVTAAYVGRMVELKGVTTLVSAQQRLRASGLAVDLLLVGGPDPENPTSIDEARLREWQSLPGVRWLGRQQDIRAVWAQAHIAVLASLGGEGLPMSLVEAAAMGRPIVATDIPGNRAIAQPGVSGILVPPDDAGALAAAIAELAGNAALRARLGAGARALAVEKYSAPVVAAATREFYGNLLARIGETQAGGRDRG